MHDHNMSFISSVDRFNRQLTAKLNPCKPKAAEFGSVAVHELSRPGLHSEVPQTSDNRGTLMTRESGNSADDPNSFHRAMRPVLRIARVFGHIPVEGVAGANADTLRFRWCSWKVIYSLYCILGSVFMLCIHSSDLFISQGSATFSRSSSILFSSVAIFNITFCLILAKQWPALQNKIQNLEVAMKVDYGYPSQLSCNLRIVTFTIFLVSLAEHVISRVEAINFVLQCTTNVSQFIRVYYCRSYTIIFTYLFDFSYIVAILLEHTRLVQVFAWNFMDVLVIVFSVMLTARLRQVSARLNAVRNMVMPERFWRQVREDYNNLSKLIKLIDQHINKIILLTFGNNLYFICLQLLLSMQKQMSVTQSVYFYSSFLHLLLRSTAMCLYAAGIHEQGSEPKSVLFSVSSESYSMEVQRFITQVTTDNIALTGLRFFSITKTLLLTVAGTIVTYEIVLVQFEDSDDSKSAKVANPFCPNKTILI